MVIKAGNYAPSFTLSALIWSYGYLHLVPICWDGRGPTAKLARQLPLRIVARQCLSFSGQHSNGKNTGFAKTASLYQQWLLTQALISTSDRKYMK